MRRRSLLAYAAVAFAAPLLAPPLHAQGAKASSPFGTSVLALKPGEWIWDARVAPEGPIMVVINLKTQRGYVYRNGIRIGATTISSGKPGRKTPTGIFQILQKHKDHKSNLYDSAPMPYMQRLTWDGIALHAGNLPGYPASHGCIRMPMEFAKNLFEVSNMGMTVVVHDEAAEPQTVADTAMLAPIVTGDDPEAVARPDVTPDEVSRWTPDMSPTGPVTIVLSTSSKRIVVYRNGVEIGRSRVGVPAGFDIGTRAAQFAGRDAASNAQWIYLALPGYAERKGQNVEQDAINMVRIPPQFYAQMRSVVGEGTTLLATDGGITGGSTGKELTVMASDR